MLLIDILTDLEIKHELLDRFRRSFQNFREMGPHSYFLDKVYISYILNCTIRVSLFSFVSSLFMFLFVGLFVFFYYY